LVEELWDSLTDEDIEPTPEQRAELERRRERLERDGPAGRPWREVLDALDRRGE
jgi:putative addiction module component (TIGR02574 family)